MIGKTIRTCETIQPRPIGITARLLSLPVLISYGIFNAALNGVGAWTRAVEIWEHRDILKTWLVGSNSVNS